MLGRARGRVAIAACIGLSVLVSCGDPFATPQRDTASLRSQANLAAEYPSSRQKTRSWRDATDAALWASGAQMDSVFAVGLKARAAVVGNLNGRRLATEADLTEGKAMLATEPGVQITLQNDKIALVRVKIPSPQALSRIRQHPNVSYVEPALVANFDIQTGDSGCSWPAGGGLYQVDSSGDLLPRAYVDALVDRAWAYSNGQGEWIGHVDTGLNGHADFLSNWATGQSSGRPAVVQSSTIGGWVPCSHGTRLASILASPRNGEGPQGVAWKANLRDIQFSNNPWEVTGTDAYQATADAINFPSRVIVMPWTSVTNHEAIGDLIRFAHQSLDIVFVAAAGTTFGAWNQNNVLFPAELPEVLAVSAANFDGTRDIQSHYGPELDLVSYQSITSVGEYFASISNAANSSAATALVGGVAALVRARYPSWTNTMVENRLRATAGAPCGKTTAFGPIVNAEAAVGGICVPNAKPVGPSAFLFDHVASGDTRTSVTAQYCVYPTGGTGPIEITWTNGSHANCRSVTFSRGNYTTLVTVQVRDTGASLSAFPFVLQVTIEDLDSSCPTCV